MLETLCNMPEPILEEVLQQKQFQKEQLLLKLEFLISMPKIMVSYDINLEQGEQIKLAKQGLYRLTRDLMYYKRNYGSPDTEL